MSARVNVSKDFETIKERIITHFDDTQDQKLRKLLVIKHFGMKNHQLPSAMLATGNDNLVRLRFLEMIPQQIKVVLAMLEGVIMDKLSEAADKMAEQLLPDNQSVVNSITSNSGTSEISELHAL